MPTFEFALLAAAPSLPAAGGYRLGYDSIFLVFFIMLGPVKALGDYFMATRALPRQEVRVLALKVFALSVVAVLVAGSVGSAMLSKWHISPPIMTLVAGIIFFLVAIRMVFAQYLEPAPSAAPATATDPPESPLMHLVFPVTVTPYGTAALITVMALSQDATRSYTIMGLAVAVMVLNLLALLSVRFILKWIGPVPLKILSAVLGILQVALAVQLIVEAISQLLDAR